MARFFYKAKRSEDMDSGLVDANTVVEAVIKLTNAGHTSIEVMQCMKITLPQSLIYQEAPSELLKDWDIVSKVNKTNKHKEVDFGRKEGLEIW